MTYSSAPETYSITSLDTIDTSILSDTITISNSSYTSSVSSNNITLNFPSNGTLSGGGITYTSGATVGGVISGSGYSHNWTYNQEEFVNCLPNIDRINEMCKQYPGLRIAYEKFVTTYKLVKDDYDTPEDQRPKP